MTPAAEGRAALLALLRQRGIADPAVLRAMADVPREAFLPPGMEEFAYVDSPLPIEEGQTISQPYIVALMADAAGVKPGDRVLEVGTGSGYAAAVLSRLAADVYTIERHRSLAELAAERLREGGYANVVVRHGDGTRGWPEAAPFDAIVVAAGGPEVPRALIDQLAPGGRIVMPVGERSGDQHLVRVRRSDGKFAMDDLGAVRFVPLIGEEGWAPEEPTAPIEHARPGGVDHAVVRLLRECAEPVPQIDSADLGSLVERIGDARVVLIGEATHGTSEFYRMRARITRELIERHGFRIVGIEGDWPDAARIHRWVQGEPADATWIPFGRFPTWMWRNRETEAFVGWLRAWNQRRAPENRAGFYGLDLYSLNRSAESVLDYLDAVDPAAARVARERYGCLTPWQRDPAAYGRAARNLGYALCRAEVVAMLGDMLERRFDYMAADGDSFLDAVQNARLVADAERYYRAMYEGGHASWNLRDRHMFDTLLTLLSWRDPNARAVVWAHNSHVGSAHATELGAQGQINIGSLARDHFGARAFLVGFGTDRGTVAAASDWDGPMEIKTVRPSWPGSYEALCHATDRPGFLLHLRDPVRPEVRGELASPRLQRAIGVVYRPETERRSHYFEASLPGQFDAWIWFDQTSAVQALPTPAELAAAPFGP
jgi:protein-L-isoaspartate(D-aspartate) O-methyltransferase